MLIIALQLPDGTGLLVFPVRKQFIGDARVQGQKYECQPKTSGNLPGTNIEQYGRQIFA